MLDCQLQGEEMPPLTLPGITLQILTQAMRPQGSSFDSQRMAVPVFFCYPHRPKRDQTEDLDPHEPHTSQMRKLLIYPAGMYNMHRQCQSGNNVKRRAAVAKSTAGRRGGGGLLGGRYNRGGAGLAPLVPTPGPCGSAGPWPLWPHMPVDGNPWLSPCIWQCGCCGLARLNMDTS